MAHATDGLLRRLVDEPFAVADATVAHVEGCSRCGARAAEIAGRAGWAARQLAGPQPVPDVDEAWQDLQARLAGRRAPIAPLRVDAPAHRRRQLVGLSVRGGIVAVTATALVTGTAAAVALSGAFAPTRVAPVRVSASDLRAVSELLDLSNVSVAAGFPTPSGTGTLPFGTLTWSSSGPARSFSSAAGAAAATGVPVRVPARVPSGVGAPTTVEAQPAVTATIRFDAAAGSLSGASVVVHAGPAVVVAYGGRAPGAGLPTLVLLTTPRPTATSTGTTIQQVESYLLSRPGVPTGLAQELRLLGNITSVLPIPTPAGLSTRSGHVDGSPG
ncbi:MAG: hypothetical protein ACYCUG_09175, partial [Acidimicrobiales bacterium]